MNAARDRLRGWWQARPPREQAVLAVGSALALLLLGWALVWQPLDRARDDLSVRLQARQSDLAFVQQAAPRLLALRQAGARGGASRQGKSLLALVDASARKAGLGPSIQRLEPLEGKRIRIEYHAANFDVFIDWLVALRQQYGVQVQGLSLNRLAVAGQVDARLTLGDP